MDYITSKVSTNFGITTHSNYKTISDLMFADDIVLLDDTTENAINHLKELKKEALKVGLKINTHKTKFMVNEFSTNLDPNFLIKKYRTISKSL